MRRVKLRKGRDRDGRRLRVDDGHGACGIDDAFAIALARLALVGGENVSAVLTEGDHVRLHARRIDCRDLVVIIQDSDAAGLGVVRILQRNGNAVVCRIHRDAGHVAVSKGCILRLHELRNVERVSRAEGAVLVDVEHVELRLRAVDDVRLAVIGVVRDDLRNAAVRICLAQRNAAHLVHRERRVRREAILFDDVARLRGDGLALAVLYGKVRGRHLGVVQVGRILGVVVRIGVIVAHDRFFLGLDIRIAALIDGRDLRILRIVALCCEHVHIARRAVLVRHRARKRVAKFRFAREERDGHALVVQLHVPLHVPFGNEIGARGDFVYLAAADEEISLRRDAAREGEFLPCAVVVSVRAGLIVEIPAVQRDARARGIVQLDETVADRLRIVRRAEYLIDDDVLDADVIRPAFIVGRTRASLRRACGDGVCRSDDGNTHRRGEQTTKCLFHAFYSFCIKHEEYSMHFYIFSHKFVSGL